MNPNSRDINNLVWSMNWSFETYKSNPNTWNCVRPKAKSNQSSSYQKNIIVHTMQLIRFYSVSGRQNLFQFSKNSTFWFLVSEFWILFSTLFLSLTKQAPNKHVTSHCQAIASHQIRFLLLSHYYSELNFRKWYSCHWKTECLDFFILHSALYILNS